MENYIKGKVTRIFFESLDGYKVGIMRVYETNDESLKSYVNHTITFNGTFVNLPKDTSFIFYGKMIDHPKYKEQFLVSSYETCLPDSNEGLIEYLSSSLFKGVGKVLATRIVDTFKEDSIKEIKNKNPRLLKIKGMTEEKFNNLIIALNENETYEELVLTLNKLGFNNKESMLLVTKYKDKINEIINTNIYLLTGDINFPKIDSIYLKNNDEKDENRINALIKYLLNKICYETGNTLVTKEMLYLELLNYFHESMDYDIYLNYLNKMSLNSEIIIFDNEIELYDYYDAEKFISDRIKYLNNKTNNYNIENIKTIISLFEEKYKITLNEDQKEAVINSVENDFYIITGGPGTGKTLIVKAILFVLEKIDKLYTKENITLLAPTGRSAKRVMESTGWQAFTIHKFLKWNKEDKKFKVNMFNKDESKVIIIDEVSMVDIFLMRNLFEGLYKDIKLIMVGDKDQLPSIGPGNLLTDLLSVNDIHRSTLNKIYRINEDSYIIDFATKIKNKELLTTINKYSDFSFINTSNDDIAKRVENLCEYSLNKNIPINSLQFLAPMYKGVNGIDRLNLIVQNIYNPKSYSKKEIIIRNIVFREGDKVLQLVNDVDNNIYNGDIGFIKKIELGKKKKVIIDFNGNYVTYTSSKFDEFTHAYVVSVHKSQGSEYDNIVLILSTSHKRMLYNKLLYTAVTRAKNSLVIIGQLEALNYGITKEDSAFRKTKLKELF